MKINWGTAIVIAFTCFMSFILYFVIKVQTDSAYDNELVIDEYYKHDAKFSEEMTQLQNSHDLTQKPQIDISENGIEITFPHAMLKKLTGKVSLYRPSDEKLDFEIPISKSGPSLLIPKTDLVGGRWDISVSWESDGMKFLQRKTVYLNI